MGRRLSRKEETHRAQGWPFLAEFHIALALLELNCGVCNVATAPQTSRACQLLLLLRLLVEALPQK
jgi:hypothetical protein